MLSGMLTQSQQSLSVIASPTCPAQTQVISHNGHAKVCSLTGTLWTCHDIQNIANMLLIHFK